MIIRIVIIHETCADNKISAPPGNAIDSNRKPEYASQLAARIWKNNLKSDGTCFMSSINEIARITVAPIAILIIESGNLDILMRKIIINVDVIARPPLLGTGLECSDRLFG